MREREMRDGKNQRITGIDASGNALVYIDQVRSMNVFMARLV